MQHLVETGRRELERSFDFPLYDWQLQAGGVLWEGHNVIVSSPTSSGKVRCLTLDAFDTVPGICRIHYILY
jgi:ATP-dependent helicase YprA (DUF1998 family)